MKIDDLFLKNQDVVLYPEDFREVLVSYACGLLTDYKLGKISFIETTEKGFAHFPVISIELFSALQEDVLVGYLCYVLSTKELRIVPVTLRFHELSSRDVAQKVLVKLENGNKEGKVAMVKKRLALRFRKQKKSTF